MKKKNVVKKDVREKKTLRRSAIKPVRPVATKKEDKKETVVPTEPFVIEKEQPKKQKKNKPAPAPVVEQENIIEENNQ